jgi:chitin elicitor receptor kinase 1
LLLASKSFTAESTCSKTCDLALASYYISEGTNITYISNIMQSKVVTKPEDILQIDTRLTVPFPCECTNGELLGHTFLYKAQHGDDYASIAEVIFSNLTTEKWMERVNIYPPSNVPDNATLNITVHCFCGNREVSKDYGLFITYPLRSEDTLESIAKDTNLDAELLQRYNPGVDFSQGHGLVFIPGKGWIFIFLSWFGFLIVEILCLLWIWFSICTK